MPAPLSILSIEDQPTDTEIILFELRQWGLEVTCTRVDTEEAFLAHLSADLDIILADYALPRFSALRALELLRQRGLDIPFIAAHPVQQLHQPQMPLGQGRGRVQRVQQIGQLGPRLLGHERGNQCSVRGMSVPLASSTNRAIGASKRAPSSATQK